MQAFSSCQNGIVSVYEPNRITVRIFFIKQTILIVWQGAPAVITTNTSLFEINLQINIFSWLYISGMLLLLRQSWIKILGQIISCTKTNRLYSFDQQSISF